jgi:hypothetical protein
MNRKKVCFLVGSLSISGGTYVIIQHAAYLHGQGYDVTLAVQESFTAETLGWHDLLSQLHCIPFDTAKSQYFDLVIATWWKTAIEIGAFRAPRYAYFVQSIESRFYRSEEEALRELVDATYEIPVAYITEATWIRDYLTTNYGHDVALVRNGIRKDLYNTTGKTIAPRDKSSMPRVLVEGHFGVHFKNTALGVRLARKAGAKDIWVLTGSPVRWIPGVSRLFSGVPMSITPDIYRSCDILIKLSTVEGMFGPPLEIFHCGGTALVFDVTGHDEYIVSGQNACVTRKGDLDGVVASLRRLLNDRSELVRLQTKAIETAHSWPSWDESSAAFHTWVETVLTRPAVDNIAIAEICEKMHSHYIRREQERLGTGFRLSRYQLSRLAAHLPSSLQRYLKQLEAVWEVLFGLRGLR